METTNFIRQIVDADFTAPTMKKGVEMEIDLILSISRLVCIVGLVICGYLLTKGKKQD